jgi:ABC-type tungstate transport system substrate-binding protein
MLPTCVLNFRCIIGAEHFQKKIVLKEGLKYCQYTFKILINIFIYLLISLQGRWSDMGTPPKIV